jgi:hypothetical protein
VRIGVRDAFCGKLIDNPNPARTAKKDRADRQDGDVAEGKIALSLSKIISERRHDEVRRASEPT